MIRKSKNFIFGVLAVLFFLNILAWIAVYEVSQPRFLEVNFFDVGQGDAIFIVTPKRHQILIDGGPTPTILEKLAKEMPFWDRSIDLIILTHPSADHLNGLLMVLDRYKIDQILWTGIEVKGAGYQRWIELIAKEKAEIFIAQAGQRIILSKNISLDILHPAESLEGKEVKGGKAINNTSIITRLVYNQDFFLFTGDIEKEVEKELVKREVFLDSDILKVAHQGSKTSTSKEFIGKVSPEIAVIQVGKDNRYDHPHQEVLDILEKYGIKILRTDLNGDIKIFSDGENLKIKNQK